MRAISTAFLTRSTSSCWVLSFVEKERKATRGVSPVSSAPARAEAIPIAASLTGGGSMLIAQSAKMNSPFSPRGQFGTTIRKKLEIARTPGAGLMICSAGRIVSPVAWIAPARKPSTSPACSIIVPKWIGSATRLAASASSSPLGLRSSKKVFA